MDHRKRLVGWAIYFGLAAMQVVACVPARAEAAYLPDNRLGSRTAPILLLTRSEVQADLGLSADQVNSAQAEIVQLRNKAVQLRGKRGTEAAAARRQVDEEELKWLNTNLSAEQSERLRQLDLQWEGPASLVNRPNLGEYLRLTAEQRQTISQVLSAQATKPAADPAQARSLLEQEIARTMTEGQRALWKALLGKPCSFTTATPAPNSDAAPEAERPRGQG
jgi:hypothetical protein